MLRAKSSCSTAWYKLVVLGVASCGRGGAKPATPEGSGNASATPSGLARSVGSRRPSATSSPVGSSSAGLGRSPPLLPTDSALGRFRLRLEINPIQPDDSSCGPSGCAICLPAIGEISAWSSSEAWVAGSCGLRGQLTRSGFVDMSAPWQTVHRPRGGLGDCEGYVSYLTVFARSPTEAYASSLLCCGLDPNSLWTRPLERFDGHRWRPISSPWPFRDPHESTPDLFAAGASGPVYVAALGDDWHGPPLCGVYQLDSGGIRLLKSCRTPKAADASPSGDAERFRSLAVDRAGTLWISGERGPIEPQDAPRDAFLWHRSQGVWQKEPFEEAGALGLSDQGSLWLSGKHLWQLESSGWRRVDSEFPPLGEVVARVMLSPSDVWIAEPERVLHYDGQRLTNVPLEALDDRSSIRRLQARGSGVWVSSQFRLWELERPGATTPPAVTMELGVAPHR